VLLDALDSLALKSVRLHRGTEGSEGSHVFLLKCWRY